MKRFRNDRWRQAPFRAGILPVGLDIHTDSTQMLSAANQTE